jgi:hypothetical protein
MQHHVVIPCHVQLQESCAPDLQFFEGSGGQRADGGYHPCLLCRHRSGLLAVWVYQLLHGYRTQPERQVAIDPQQPAFGADLGDVPQHPRHDQQTVKELRV